MTRFFKAQTKWTWVPAFVCGEASSGSVNLRIRAGYSSDPDHPCPDCKTPVSAEIDLTEHEAMSLAAWLQTEAERITKKKLATAQRKAKSRSARNAKKESL